MNRREFLSQTVLAGAALACGASIAGANPGAGDEQAARRNKHGAARIYEHRPCGKWVKVHRPGADVDARMVNYGG
jgi:nitrous oxide reductase